MPNILITGASGGLGAALAQAHAGSGTHLALWGRDQTRLEGVATACRNRGASVETVCFDLCEIDRMITHLEDLDGRRPLDLAIFNAGLGGVTPADRACESPERAHAMALVNFTAPVVGASTIAEGMAARGRGQIVLMSSIAESFPLPMAPTYAGSKAGLAMFAEALQLRLLPRGVTVTLVSPGFIDTPMSRSVPSPRPFLMSAEAAAALIAAKIAQRRPRIVVPWPFAVIRAASRVLPRALMHAVLRRL